MKKILMISYYFPPLADVGGLRASGFARHLREYGWEPAVLTVSNPDRAASIPGTERPPEGIAVHAARSIVNLAWITGKANGLLSRILNGLGIRYTKPFLRDLLCLPDEYVGWVPLAALKGLRLVRSGKIDLIYVTCKPFSSALIGWLLKRLTGKPLVLDFRDPVSPDYAASEDPYYRTYFVFRLIRIIEERVLRRADLLLVTTEETRRQYESFFPFLRGRTAVVYNGFADECFRHPAGPAFDGFTIVYSGNFYSGLIAPDPFFRGLQLLFERDPRMRARVVFTYVGNREPWLQEMTERYGLGDAVRVTGRVSRRESVGHISAAPLLLLRIVPGKISTKLFEGLAAGAPLLALIDHGEVSRLIRTYAESTYYIVAPGDEEGIARAVADAFRCWSEGRLVRRQSARFAAEFNKHKLTGDFARLIDAVLAAAPSESKGAVPG